MKSLFLLVAMFAGTVMFGAGLEPGQNAPEIKVAEWVKGGPVSISEGKGKNVYIVEFWATWCPPCRMSIPHLSKLQKEYKNKGLVVVGITRESLATVKPFVDKQKDMNYNVAVDTAGTTYSKYMEGISGIPHAFIINKEGVVVWSGHPLEMESVVEEVVNGTFDMTLNSKLSKLQKELQEKLKSEDMAAALATAKKILVLKPSDDMAMRVVMYLYRQKQQTKELLAFLDELISMHPANSKTYIVKLHLLCEMEDVAGIKNLATVYTEQFHGNGSKLNSIAWALLEDVPFGLQPLKEALAAAKQSVESGPADDKMILAAHMDTLARCYYAVGRIDKAIAEQEKAITLIKGSDEEPMFTAKLNFYKEALKVGKSIK